MDRHCPAEGSMSAGGVVVQVRVCLIYRGVLVGRFVSCGIHMNVRSQGFPAEDYKAATWVMLVIYTVSGFNVAAGGCAWTAWHQQQSRSFLPEWNRQSQRSTASDWPAPAAPPSSPGPWNRRSADSEKNPGKQQANTVTSADFYTFSCGIIGLLCSPLMLWSALRHLRVMAWSSGCTVFWWIY